MITPQNLVRHELIGLYARVVQSSNPEQIGISGTIIDESRNMLVIRTERGIRRIQKHKSVFELHLPDDTRLLVDGSVLVMQPEKRVGMRIKDRGKKWQEIQD
jgi:ribonuclease P protein subunit POP4